MRSWSLRTEPVAPRRPQVLQSDVGEGRAILLSMPAGKELSDHAVQERAYVFVVTGRIDIRAGADAAVAADGGLVVLDPRERHTVRAVEDTRLLIVLSPWPSPHHRGLVREQRSFEPDNTTRVGRKTS